jgi:hypothetical protein
MIHELESVSSIVEAVTESKQGAPEGSSPHSEPGVDPFLHVIEEIVYAVRVLAKAS